MTKTIASIYDTKAEAWSTPLFFNSNAEAIRTFSDVVNNAETQYGRHPEDYILFNIGTFDEQTGEIVGGLQVSLEHGINLVTPQQPQLIGTPHTDKETK